MLKALALAAIALGCGIATSCSPTRPAPASVESAKDHIAADGVTPSAAGGHATPSSSGQRTGRRVVGRALTVDAVQEDPAGDGDSNLIGEVSVANDGGAPFALDPAEFSLISAEGDIFGLRSGLGAASAVTVAPGGMRSLHLAFVVPAHAVHRAALLYRPAGGGVVVTVVLPEPEAARTAYPAGARDVSWQHHGSSGGPDRESDGGSMSPSARAPTRRTEPRWCDERVVG